MSLNRKLLEKRIAEINEKFDKSHYLEIRARSIDSIFRMLKYKSIKYKESIENMQNEMTKEMKRRVRVDHHTLVACTVAAKTNKSYSFGTSHRVVESCDSRLRTRLEQLGKIGQPSNVTSSSNTIGKCAEVKAANQVLQADQKLEFSKIEFTPAIRPRTLEEVPRCPNCTAVFGQCK